MARVTKINVGGTNYDIAHEGELKNSGFEVVTALPTTGLFAGREVMYNGKKYVYSSGWKEEITANTMYEDKLLYNSGTIVSDGSVIDRLIMPSGMANAYAYTKSEAISVQYSQDAGETWSDYELSDLDKQNLCTFSKSIYCGGPGVTAGNVNYRLRVNLFPRINRTYIFHKLSLKFSYGTASNRWLTIRCLRKNQEDIDANYVTIVDKGNISGSTGLVFVNLGDINMINFYDKVVLDIGYDSIGAGKGLTLNSLSMYATYSSPENYLAAYGRMYHYDINKKSYFDGAVSSKELINFDVNNIEPTQTGSSVSKTSTWLWQYLVQAVNWLKANNVRLSAYNTKVAALEQADSDNNAYTQSVKTDLSAAIEELSNGLATVARSGSYNDLTDKPTFSGSYNDLTDKPTLFSGSYNDLTDKPALAPVATSGDYNDLLNKPAFSGSYNDLTDKPTLATVATSGSYNDLTDKPSFSGSYNDLTDKPTLFSGSYNDLTDKPTLATVATSGSYNDLTDKPTLATVATSGSYNDLTDKPTFSGSYNDLTDKPTLFSGSYNDLTDKPLIPSTFEDLGGNIATAQITDGSITNTKLANSSMTLNGISCELGGTKTLPCIISFNSTLYKVRIYQNWLQIYHAGTWVNKYYLLSNPPTECRYITDLSDPSWYDESVTEYELDNSATEQLLRADSSDNIANWIEAIGANQITFNSSVIPSKVFNKGALDNIISNLKGKGYSVFVENDLDTILTSGNDWVISIKIKRFNNLYKAIIECYVAR